MSKKDKEEKKKKKKKKQDKKDKKVKNRLKARSDNYKSTLEKFNLAPDVKLKKKEKKIIRIIAENDDADFYYLADELDLRPSKLIGFLCDLETQGLIALNDEDLSFEITEAGKRYAKKAKKESKAEKKFKEFLRSLNDDELQDFCELCDQATGGKPVAEKKIVVNPVSKPIAKPVVFREEQDDDDDFTYVPKTVRRVDDDDDDSMFLAEEDFGDFPMRTPTKRAILKNKKLKLRGQKHL